MVKCTNIKFTMLIIYNVQFSGTKCIYILMQPAPPSISRTLFILQHETLPLEQYLPTSPFPHCKYILPFVYPCTHQWMLEGLLPFGCCE